LRIMTVLLKAFLLKRLRGPLETSKRVAFVD
jgi:hypothetical protein